jgi:hypothetical protein
MSQITGQVKLNLRFMNRQCAGKNFADSTRAACSGLERWEAIEAIGVDFS